MEAKFNKFVLSKFKKWDNFTYDFRKAIPEIDFSTASPEEKEVCIKILKRTMKRMRVGIKHIKGEEK